MGRRSYDRHFKMAAVKLVLEDTKKGVLFLAVFLDIFSRKVSGWSMGRKMKETLVMDAFMQAYHREHPKEGLIVHTDQGSQYTGSSFQHCCVHMEQHLASAEKAILMTMP